MLVKHILLNNQYVEFGMIVSDEFAQAFSEYNFKDMKEVNEVFQWADRCTNENIHDWCNADTRNLLNYLGG